MNWYAALTGYLEISLWGDDPERVINMAISRGINLWDIWQKETGCYTLKVRLGGYKALRHLVRRSSCRMKTTGKEGIPFLFMRARKRKILVAGLLFFSVSLYILSSFVWFIEVNGNKKVKTAEIVNIVQNYGLKVGAPKSAFSCDKIKDRLLIDIPELAWAGVHIQGTKVIIEVAEKTLILPDNEEGMGNIVARMEGTVEELLVLKGTALVKEKDHIQKGQALIAGLSYPQIQVNPDGSITPSGKPKQVRARGLVRARVQHSRTGVCLITEERDQDTGCQTIVYLCKFRGREIILRGPKTIPYEHYRTVTVVKTLGLGRIPGGVVEFITIVYIEQDHEIKEWGLNGAYQEALKRAKDEVMKELPADSRFIVEKHEPLPAEKSDLIRVKYTLETIEDIGRYVPIKTNDALS